MSVGTVSKIKTAYESGSVRIQNNRLSILQGLPVYNDPATKAARAWWFPCVQIRPCRVHLAYSVLLWNNRPCSVKSQNTSSLIVGLHNTKTVNPLASTTAVCHNYELHMTFNSIRAKSTILGFLPEGMPLEVWVGYPIPPVLNRNTKRNGQAKKQGAEAIRKYQGFRRASFSPRQGTINSAHCGTKSSRCSCLPMLRVSYEQHEGGNR